MRFYTQRHRHYCGIDLHARSMYLCVLSHDGEIVLHRNADASPAALLDAVAPYRDDLVAGAECIFCWYWLADLCAREKIPFVLGYALYMKAIDGGKAKSDRLDSLKIATLLRGGTFLAHIQNTNSQYNLPPFGKKIAYRTHREGVAEHFPDPAVQKSIQKSIQVDVALIDRYESLLTDLELYLARSAKVHDPQAFHRLRTIPAWGRSSPSSCSTRSTRFAASPGSVQGFLSYSRLVKCAKESAGKRTGSGGKKIGNVHLKWAFSEGHRLPLRGSRRSLPPTLPRGSGEARAPEEEVRRGQGPLRPLRQARSRRLLHAPPGAHLRREEVPGFVAGRGRSSPMSNSSHQG